MSENERTREAPRCNDFEFKDGRKKKGCGAKVMLKKVDGRWKSFSPFMVECLARGGETQLMWVPHWAVCPHDEDFREAYYAKQEEKRREFQDSRNGFGGEEEEERPRPKFKDYRNAPRRGYEEDER